MRIILRPVPATGEPPDARISPGEVELAEDDAVRDKDVQAGALTGCFIVSLKALSRVNP
jgi:hypothetical protein